MLVDPNSEAVRRRQKSQMAFRSAKGSKQFLNESVLIRAYAPA
jgi:hypothetical protein